MKYMWLIGLTLIPALLSAKPGTDAKYNQKLDQQISILNSSDTVEAGWLWRANQFRFLGGAKKTDWRPYYYAAYCFMNAAFKEKSGNAIDSLAGLAEQNLGPAIALNGDTSEVYCLRAFTALAMLGANPMERGMTYSRKINEYLGAAEKANPENPRIYYIRAIFLKNMPAAFGGGESPAKAQISMAKEKFTTFKPKSAASPNWGRAETENMFVELGGTN